MNFEHIFRSPKHRISESNNVEYRLNEKLPQIFTPQKLKWR